MGKKLKVTDDDVEVVEKKVVGKQTMVEKKEVKGGKMVKKAVVEKKESNATKSGKLAKKVGKVEKKDMKFTESVTEGRGTTRSGKKYTI